MDIQADGAVFGERGGTRPEVHCAACGSRFESADAAPGARLRCPLCQEVVELAGLIARKRRVPTASSKARIDMGIATATPARRAPRAPQKTRARTILATLGLAVVAVLAAAGAALFLFRHEIRALLAS